MPIAVILTSHSIDFQAVDAYLSNSREETIPQGTVYQIGQFKVWKDIQTIIT